jgi:4-hydroxy-tetrahydrodipicolinate reductase
MKLGIIGYSGKMGQALLQEAKKQNILVPIVHSRLLTQESFITDNYLELVKKVDVVVDFSRPETSLKVLKYCLEEKKAYLCGTTGFSANEMQLLRDAGQKIKLFYSANMSLGIAILNRITRLTIEAFKKEDIPLEVVILEKHHKEKVDKPSGTAMNLATYIRNTTNTLVDDIVSLRYDSIIGEHEVIISSNLELLNLKHEAKDRSLFALGAIKAAKFLYKQELPNFYTMEDLFL